MIYDLRNIDLLLDDCLAGKEAAQKVLYKSFFGFGKSICLRYSNNREDAEEVLNDGFMKAFKNLHKYDRVKPFKAWFRTILVNTCIDYYRRKEKITAEFDDSHHNLSYQYETPLEKLNAEDILEQVQKLPFTYRSVFIMYAIDGYSHKEIAEALQINEVTSRTNYLKARLKLQMLLSNLYGGNIENISIHTQKK
jgi:RNA polymerase sigma-70 factor, ECF subfamily